MAHLPPYIGRLAPSPTGLLHLGHACTFRVAATRAREANGRLLLRNDDLDTARCRPEFTVAFQEDLRWLGLNWEEPIRHQSERNEIYLAAMHQLHQAGLIYPCSRSRKEVAAAASAPHEDGLNDEPMFPPEWRIDPSNVPDKIDDFLDSNWRFRVPDGERVVFEDSGAGPQAAVAGQDFGDFLVWRKDGVPSYQLACAADDADMGITEVVRGADLIKSTFRQLLILEALGAPTPSYHHAPLITDDSGERLAKRHDSLSLRSLREQGTTPIDVVKQFDSNRMGASEV